MLFDIFKYSFCLIATPAIVILSYLNYNNKSMANFCVDTMMIYCRIEENLIKYKTTIDTLYRKQTRIHRFSPPDDVFFYKNNIVIGNTTIVNLIIGSYLCDREYDFVTYELISDSGEKICRIFDDETVMMNEFTENQQILCSPSKTHILSALLIITRNGKDELYDITPKGLGVELVGNSLYSYNFIKYFFNIDPGINYTVKIIDNNIGEMYLVNNLQQSTVVSIENGRLVAKKTMLEVDDDDDDGDDGEVGVDVDDVAAAEDYNVEVSEGLLSKLSRLIKNDVVKQD